MINAKLLSALGARQPRSPSRARLITLGKKYRSSDACWILKALHQNSPLTRPRILLRILTATSHTVALSPKGTGHHLKDLQQRGLVDHVGAERGSGAGRPATLHAITPTGSAVLAYLIELEKPLLTTGSDSGGGLTAPASASLDDDVLAALRTKHRARDSRWLLRAYADGVARTLNDALRDVDRLTSNRIGLRSSSGSRHISELERDGLLCNVGKDPHANIGAGKPPFLYRITDRGRLVLDAIMTVQQHFISEQGWRPPPQKSLDSASHRSHGGAR